MANVGDLFVNVRARTTALTRGLRSARRSVRRFATSTTGLLAGIGAGLLGFKAFSFVMGSLITGSKEFREQFARLKNTITDLGQEFARRFGTQLASGVSDLADWLATSEKLREVIEGIGPLFTDVIIPAVQMLARILDPVAEAIAAIINEVTGVNSEMRKLGKGISDPSEIESATRFRSSIGVRSREQRFALAAQNEETTRLAEIYFRRMDEKTAVPR